jgi:hypothetical protein
MSVFKTSADAPLEKRVEILEEKVRDLEAQALRRPGPKTPAKKTTHKEEDETCVIT